MNNQGTPKTLREAIRRAQDHSDKVGNFEFVAHSYVKDFLAQRFGAAMLNAETPEEADRLEALFKRIVIKDE